MLRSVVAFALGFVVLGAAGVLTANLFTNSMLVAAGWQPGVAPPLGYIWTTLAADFAGSLLAGLVLAWVAGKWANQTALALILLVAAMRAYQYISALGSNPHWYSLALIFIPLVGVPLGVMLRKRLSWSNDRMHPNHQ